MKSFGKILGIILGIAVVAGGTCGILIAVNGGFKAQETVETPIPEPEPDPIATAANMRILYAGTTFWGRNTNVAARASELGVK